MSLTDDQWLLVEPLLTPVIPARSHLGRPPIDERAVLDGILWKISHNTAWYDLPPEYPSYQTCFRRYRLLKSRGVLHTILEVLLKDLLERGEFDFVRLYADGKIIIKNTDGMWRCTFDPPYTGTWQQSTALIFVGLAVKSLKRRCTLTIETSASPDKRAV